MLTYDFVELLPREMAFLLFVGTPLYPAFAHQESSEFRMVVAFNLKTHIFTADFQFGYPGELDGVLGHSGTPHPPGRAIATAKMASANPVASGPGTARCVRQREFRFLPTSLGKRTRHSLAREQTLLPMTTPLTAISSQPFHVLREFGPTQSERRGAFPILCL